MNKNTRLKALSKEYVKDFSDSLALFRLEAKINSEPGRRIQYVTAGYLYYNKDKIDKEKFPTLYRIREDFSNSIKRTDKLNPYWKVNNSLVLKVNLRNHDIMIKEIMIKEMNDIIIKNNVKIASVSRAINVDNSVFTKYLRKGQVSFISKSTSSRALKYLRENYG